MLDEIRTKRTRQPISHDPKVKFLEANDIFEALEREQNGIPLQRENVTPQRPVRSNPTDTTARAPTYDVCLGNWSLE
jgi:hypothetical protein